MMDPMMMMYQQQLMYQQMMYQRQMQARMAQQVRFETRQKFVRGEAQAQGAPAVSAAMPKTEGEAQPNEAAKATEAKAPEVMKHKIFKRN